jgi:carbonic anhydrase/acetyltransferase-like protein (isoleucine patch superfamily)
MLYTKEHASNKYPGVEFGGDIWIGAGAVIGSGASFEGSAWIEPKAWICSGACIRSDVIIGCNAWIGAGSEIWNESSINAWAIINSGAIIAKERKNVKNSMVISGISETKSITGFECDDGLVICFGFLDNYLGLSLEEARKEVAKKYPLDHYYFKYLKLIEYWCKSND